MLQQRWTASRDQTRQDRNFMLVACSAESPVAGSVDL